MSETLARLFRHAVSYGKQDMILTKTEGRYQPIAAQEFHRRTGRLRMDLERAGVGKGDRCALLSENRWEWAAADFAMMTGGVVSVPLYPTLPAEQIHYLLEHSEARLIFVSTRQQLDKILAIWPRLPHLQEAVVFDNVEPGDERVKTLEELIGDQPLTGEEEQRFEASISAVEPGDLASIIYTSGTTGVPKGVMLTHANIASNVRDVPLRVTSEDTALSFLPLSHIAERTADYVYFHNGTTVAYAESLETVPQNMLEVRPTLAFAVPRFFEKVHGRVMDAMAAAPPIRRKLFDWAISVGREATPYTAEGRKPPAGLGLKLGIANALVFKKLRGRVGGRLRLFVSGAAPLAKHLAEFFHAAGLPIYEAYGLTETSPVISMNTPGAVRFGTVGKVIRNVEVKIAEDGEILVRGPNVMQGYFKNPEATAETIVDGWLHTGDVGALDAEGYLSITDRKKDLFKTSGGKFVAPAPIENQLKTSEYIATAMVVAEARRFPSAVIVPDFDKLRRYAKEKGIETASNSGLTSHPEIRKLVDDEAQRVCAGLARHEIPKKTLLLDRELSLEDGEITPTMKIRRRAVEERFRDEIEALYAE